MFNHVKWYAAAAVAIACLWLGCAGSMPPAGNFEGMERKAGEGESEIVVNVKNYGYSYAVKILINGKERLRLREGETKVVIVPNGEYSIRAELLAGVMPAAYTPGGGKASDVTVDAMSNRIVFDLRYESGRIQLSKYSEIPLDIPLDKIVAAPSNNNDNRYQPNSAIASSDGGLPTNSAIASTGGGLPKIAVYVTSGADKSMAAKLLAGAGAYKIVGDGLAKAIGGAGKCDAVNLTGDITKAHGAMVGEAQAADIGRQFGVQYLSIVTISNIKGKTFNLGVRLVDVAASRPVASASEAIDLSNAPGMLQSLGKIAKELVKGIAASAVQSVVQGAASSVQNMAQGVLGRAAALQDVAQGALGSGGAAALQNVAQGALVGGAAALQNVAQGALRDGASAALQNVAQGALAGGTAALQGLAQEALGGGAAAAPAQYGQPVQQSASAQYGQPVQMSAPAPYGQPVQMSAPAPYGQPVQMSAPAPYGQPVQQSASAPYGQPVQQSAPAAAAIPATVRPSIAVYVKGGLGENEKKALGTTILVNLVNSGRYRDAERTAPFLADADKELKARGAAVDNGHISKLGKQFDINFVCVVDVTPVFGEFQVSARMVNVETASTELVGTAASPLKSLSDLEQTSESVAKSMFGQATRQR